ncbi:MAG: hypothetical protein KDC46_01090 [Thermoleophilia bacterium]|nr:hypothetical protein [Thermoleophilia bacterium]
MQAITPIPQFTVRWTEPLGALRTRQHELDVNVVGESGTSPLRGHVTAHTEDNLGPIPAGGSRSETRFLRGEDAMGAVESLWKQVKRDRIEQWIPEVTGTDPGRLDRNDIELVVNRNGSESPQVFRTDLEHAPQPVQDLLAAAAHIHADVRLHPSG